MKKETLNEEFKRMQELAGIINEMPVIADPTDPNIADFLNQHKEEVFEKLFNDYSNPNIYGAEDGLNIEEMEDWKNLSSDNSDGAQTDFPDVGVGCQARFTPFPPDEEDEDEDEEDVESEETNIAGKTIYYSIFEY